MWALILGCFAPLARVLAGKNLAADRFGTWAAVLGVALGTATVQAVLILDESTSRTEAENPTQNPQLALPDTTVRLVALRPDGTAARPQDALEETHEDYEVMRSAIRLGSLSAFAIGALIVFFTLTVVVERRRKEVLLLRSIGATDEQLASIFTRQACAIALWGTALGMIIAVPLALLLAKLGITTTGRSRISFSTFAIPWSTMLAVSALGALSALLGLIRPVRSVLAVRPADGTALERRRETRGRARGFALFALPLSAAIFVVMRPFFRDALPSLTFFVVEAFIVAVLAITSLVLVPDVVQRLGQLTLRLVPSRFGGALLLLSRRRLQYEGHELAWSVGGIMLVFSLLLSLHIAIRALQQEVVSWGEDAVAGQAFIVSNGHATSSELVARRIAGDGTSVVPMSGITPWPSPVRAVRADDLRVLAANTGDAEVIAMAEHFDEHSVILSRMMARRLDAEVGGSLVITSADREAELRIIGITDAIGYAPHVGTYRNSKTYALIDASHYRPLLARYAGPMGHANVLVPPPGGSIDQVALTDRYWTLRADDLRTRRTRFVTGEKFIASRVRETARDFVIFDLILLMTSGLAAIGMANQLLLSVRSRRRELSLLRVIGMTPSQVGKLILLEGAFTGIVGGVLAAALGIPLGYATLGALQAVSAFTVEFELPLSYVIFTIAAAGALATLASLWPAYRARRTLVAEAVHYE